MSLASPNDSSKDKGFNPEVANKGTKKRALNSSPKVAFILHLLAGIVLLVFALSHFAFLAMYDNSRDSANPVFPFLHNGGVYFCAGMFEMATSAVCFCFPGRHRTNFGILGFVMVIIWYKVTFYFLGGVQCGCLGLLGRLLHVSKLQEIVLPDLALLLLVATTSPWLLNMAKRIRWPFSACPSKGVPSLLIALVVIAPLHVSGARTICIQGEIDSAHYNPITGHIFTNNYVSAAFSAFISDYTWDLRITNQIDNTRWARLAWDGTNTYLFQPNGGNFYSHKPPVDNSVLVTISPSPIFHSLDQDDIGLAPLWLTYGFLPIAATTDAAGVIALPLSWRGSRSSSQAYGYQWKIGKWVGGRFIDEIDVVRDQALDLAPKDELLRNEMDYPETLVSFNVRNQAIQYRREIPDGFREATYRCKNWYKTNELLIPFGAEFKWYLPPAPRAKNDKPTYIANLTANNILIRDDVAGFAEMGTAEKWRIVHDYRYKTANENRIFKYAQYELQAGERFRAANDPNLQAQAEAWLIHGKKFGDFSNRGAILSWLLLAAIIVPAIVLIWKKGKHKETT